LQHRPVESADGIAKIKSMLLAIRNVFVLIPFESHKGYCSYKSSYSQQGRL